MNRARRPGSGGVNRLAWGLVLLVLLLIGVGGLISARGAGMAIPDWPTVFGHWFLPSPRQPLDVLLNQLHRVLAQLSVVWAMVLATALWRLEGRATVRWLGTATAAMLLAAGFFGAGRILAQSPAAGQFHAILALLAFGLCVAMATVTSPRWLSDEDAWFQDGARGPWRWCFLACLASYLFAFASLPLRHMSPMAGLHWVPFWTWSQVSLGLASVVATGLLLLRTGRHLRHHPARWRGIAWFSALLTGQLLAGGAAWVASFGWPPWFSDHIFPVSYPIVTSGPFQVVAVTVHVILGAATPAVGVSMVLRAYRSVQPAGGRPAR
ncbi:MAG: hypothetical protein U1E05_25885 [Patescibacteria group bacterium]|nr:hypothetical protein [Patescibacteria group bacterium]